MKVMLEKDKQLLLKDICERIPYGVKCTTKANGWKAVYPIRGCADGRIFLDCPEEVEGDDEWLVQNIVPYLRPMSSMTEEENTRRCAFLDDIEGGVEDAIPNYIDWLDEHHFDHRGLIDMGLAIEAPNEMYGKKLG